MRLTETWNMFMKAMLLWYFACLSWHLSLMLQSVCFGNPHSELILLQPLWLPGHNFQGTYDYIMYSHNCCLSYTIKRQCISVHRIVDAFLFLECLPTLLFCIVTCCIKRWSCVFDEWSTMLWRWIEMWRYSFQHL